MYCRKCGEVLTGKFCAGCGLAIDLPLLRDYESLSHLLQDSRIESLIGRRFAPSGRKFVTDDDVLKTADRALNVAIGVSLPIPLDISAKLGFALWSALGVKAVASDSASIRSRFAYVAIACLCHFRQNNMEVVRVSDEQSKGIIQAAVPESFLWTGPGQFHVVIGRKDDFVTLDAAVEFPGQGFAWGRGTKLVAELLSQSRHRANELSQKQL